MIPLQDVIPRGLADIVRKAPLCPEKVDFAWRTAVGPITARATRVSLDANGVLHVTCIDAHWKQAVARSSRMIVAKLTPMLGDGVLKKLVTD